MIVGGGFAGVAAARILSEKLDITLIEKSSIHEQELELTFMVDILHIWTRHFHTHNKMIYDYLNKIVPLRNCGDHGFIPC